MKKKIVAILLTACLSFSLSACSGGESGSSSTSASQTEVVSNQKEYISESEIPNLFTSPDDYKGKYVKLTGQIFATPEQDDDRIALQVWHDPENSSNNFIVYVNGTDSTFSMNDYIVVDGEIMGEFSGENAFGGTVTAPMIEADSIEVQSYIDAVHPTIKEITPENAVSEQNGISLKVDKIEFAEDETRIYLTETNATDTKFSMWVYSIMVIQSGQQIEQDTSSMSAYEGNYAELSSDILPNASSSGVLVFPAMDSSTGFQLYAEGMSDNYELTFNPFTIDIPAAQ